MKIKQIELARNGKVSINYQSKGYSVGATFELEEWENIPFKDFHIECINKINFLEQFEINRIKKELTNGE